MTEKKSIKRLRPKRGLGASYTRTRRIAADAVRKQREERLAQNRQAAQNELRRAEERSNREKDQEDQKYRHSIMSSVAKAERAVLESWGYDGIALVYGIDMQLNHVDAWTDFRRIHVKWPASFLPTSVFKHFEVAKQITAMKGVFRHESGHIRFTVPWTEIAKHTDANYLVNNVLEDQRMECLVVAETPKIAKVFKQMVLSVVIENKDYPAAWLLLAGRSFLPGKLLVGAHRAFDEQFGKGTADEWLAIVDQYKAATTVEAMGEATTDAGKFINRIATSLPSPFDRHDRQDNYINPNPGEDWGDRAASGATDVGETVRHYRSLEEAKNVGQGYGGGAFSFEKEVSREYDEVLKLNTSDREVTMVVRGAHEKAQIAGLPEYEGPATPMTADSVAKAEAISVGIQQALTSYVSEASPTWNLRQEQGVIDPLAFRTRKAGERDYHREFDDVDKPKLNVHLSLICDTSGSMGVNMVPLSEVLYGTALATEALEIGATFGLWSSGSEYYRVWSDGEALPVVFPSMGGTDPIPALDDLDNHNPEGADDHLVMIFTDGAWGSVPNLQRWNDGGDRTLVLVRYGFHDGSFQGDMGADEHIQISNVHDLAPHLTNALAGVMGSGSEGGWG